MKPKLLVVSERYWPNGSGGELATHLILRLLKEDFDITVVTGSRDIERVEGIRYIYTSLLSVRNKQRLWLNNLLLMRSRWLEKLVENSDVVYIPRFSFPIIQLAKGHRKKIVVHLHGYIPISYTAVVLAPAEEHLKKIRQDDISLELLKSPVHGLVASGFWWMSKLARYWISQADKVICVSKRQAEITSKAAPELAEKIEVVYNPPPPTPPPEEKTHKPTLVYSGGESYVKGFHVLLRVIPKIMRRYPGIQVFFTGRVSRKTLNTLENKTKGRITYLGRISYVNVLKMYSKSWATIFPSIWEEPLPYVVMESMLMGTIPIASRVGGVPEIVEGTYAEKMLFKPEDDEEMVKKLEKVLSVSREQLMEVSYKLLEEAKSKFSIDKTLHEFLKCIFEA